MFRLSTIGRKSPRAPQAVVVETPPVVVARRGKKPKATPSRGEVKRAKASRAKPLRKGRRSGVLGLGWVDAASLALVVGVMVMGARKPDPLQGARQAHAREPDRGRDAQTPLQMPARGWRDILARTWSEIGADRITAVAGGVTFFALLALFPALGAFVSLYGLVGDVSQAQHQLNLLSGVLPPEALSFVGDEMLRLAQARSGGLGVAFVLSLLVSLWSANGAVKALFDGLNVAYEQRETRGIVKLNLTSLAFTVGAIVFVILAVTGVVVVPVVLGYLGLSGGGRWLAELRWPLLLLVVILALTLVYRYGPSRRRAKWSWITPGSIAAAVLWLLASLLFSAYVANFGHFDKTYGSLGAVVGFMTWIWYSTIIVLAGAELNAELEHQTAMDTVSEDAPRPMGQRGARMADTLGEARKKSLERSASA